MNEDTMLWIVGLALGAYVLYQMSQSASASSSAVATVPYHKIGPDGSVMVFQGATPGQYSACQPQQGYPQLPCI